MSLLEQIRAASLAARKAKSANASFLITLLGEATRPGKDNGNRESTDEEVFKVINKFKAGLDESIKAMQARNDEAGLQKLNNEMAALTPFLPQLLTESELRNIIEALISGSPSPSIGQIFGALKKSYGGKFDGEMASAIIKETLSHG